MSRHPAPSQDHVGPVAGGYSSCIEDGQMHCDLCPRHCRLKDGQRGLCFVRARDGEEMVLTTFGRSSGFCVDPVEKKPLNHFLPGTPILSFGTAGCNLTCRYCQNWNISKAKQFEALADQAAPETIARAAEATGCRSVAYTYNDPIIFHEYAIETAKACRERDIKSVAVTGAYMDPEPAREFFAHMDAVNADLKAFSESFYRKLCTGHLQPVLDALVIAREEGCWLELTTLVIPGWNDQDSEIREMAKWVVENLGPEVPMHFSAFHPDYKMKDTPATPVETLRRARRIALDAGVRYAYTGNVHDPEGDTTWCHACGHRLIGRDWYELSDWGLAPDGSCEKCGTPAAGVFDAHPGSWGRRRLPVDPTRFAA